MLSWKASRRRGGEMGVIYIKQITTSTPIRQLIQTFVKIQLKAPLFSLVVTITFLSHFNTKGNILKASLMHAHSIILFPGDSPIVVRRSKPADEKTPAFFQRYTLAQAKPSLHYQGYEKGQMLGPFTLVAGSERYVCTYLYGGSYHRNSTSDKV